MGTAVRPPPGPAAAPEAGYDAESVLAALDPEQREVALASRGPVCVLAGAGTGKTRAVAHRIAYGVRTGVIDPGHVLAVTFTTRAAGELRARLNQLGGPGSGMERVQARTFHSAALRQLVHLWPRTVGGRPPALMDSKVSLLAVAARKWGLSTNPTDLRDIAAEIEWAKVTQTRPDEYAEAAAKASRTPPLGVDMVGQLFASYEELRRERHLIDFESVLELTSAILTEHPDAAALVRDRYRYFVVDEYQDVNPLQKLLLDSWAGGRDDVCVVGDPRQAIYSFTGASASYLTSFAVQYPDAAVVKLVRNYRSTPQVVTLANQLTGLAGGGTRAGRGKAAPAVRSVATGHPDAALVAQRGAGPAVEFTEYADEEAEAAAIAARVLALRAEGLEPRQVAVLVRINVQTLQLERAFAERGIACQVRGAERFFDRPEVKQAVGLLRAAAKSSVSQAAAGPGMDLVREAGLSGPAAEVRDILTGLGLTREPPAGRGSARDRWESLAALAQLAQDYFAAQPGAALSGFAAELAHRASIEHAPAMQGVTLASLHAAKGLEWDVVFLPGLTDGNVPIVHAQTDAAIAEERRLLYVGVTRARDRLFLSWALARGPGARWTRKPSRFLDEVRLGRTARPAAGPVAGRS